MRDVGVHPLSGQTSVDESARLIRNCRYAVERMMRILGGWIALTPEILAKLLMGRHVWDNAQHADILGRRLPELRAPAQVSEPANEAFVAFLDAVEAAERPEQTVERLVGVYGVLKPHLLASYAAHIGRANEVYEPPTRRILARCAEDERRHIGDGLAVLRHLASRPDLQARATGWQARMQALLAESGGVTGLGLPPPLAGDAGSVASDDGRELISLQGTAARWSMPDDLAAAVGRLGEALVAGDLVGRRCCCDPEAMVAEGVESALAGRRLTRHQVVALASVGRQRLVKLRLEGPDGAVVLLTRWVPSEGGWHAAALDLAAGHAARPA
jgi:hypothetical protein